MFSSSIIRPGMFSMHVSGSFQVASGPFRLFIWYVAALESKLAKKIIGLAFELAEYIPYLIEYRPYHE